MQWHIPNRQSLSPPVCSTRCSTLARTGNWPSCSRYRPNVHPLSHWCPRVDLSSYVRSLTLGSIFAVACSDGDRRSAGSSAGPAGAGPTLLDPNDWEGVLAAARGQTVNWYLWGGSESINRFVDDAYGPALKDRFGVTLRRVPIADTAKAFVFDTNSIGDFNYVAIAANASNKAAAMVVANLLLAPEMQARQIVPANGFGLGYAIDPNRVTDPNERQLLTDAAAQLGSAATDPADLAASLVGDAAAAYQDLVETGWRQALLGGL